MDSDRLISIIVNNHNYGRFLRQAIDSALTQTYPRTEVIVVDDGSTDESRKIIRGYGSRIVPVLKENGGQGSAFNAGFLASRGDVVCFLDADDALYPDALHRAAPWFEDPKIAKVHWPLAVVDETGKPTGRLFPDGEMPQGDLRETVLRDGPFYDSRILPPTSGNAWSRRFLEQVLPMPADEFDHGADVFLHSLAPLFGQLGRATEPQGFYRSHGNNHYWQSRLSDRKVAEYLGRFESCSSALAKQLVISGESPDEAGWKRRNFNYLWLTRLRDARQDLVAAIPDAGTYALVDDGEWGGEAVEGRHAVPFLERDGQFWGPPKDDEEAIFELEQLRQRGLAGIAFWWTCFWWLEHYQRFNKHLRSRFPCVVNNQRLIVFDLAPRHADRELALSS